MINAKAIGPDELENVSGGMGGEAGASRKTSQYMRMECPYCHDIFQADVSKSSVKCPTCHKIITIKG